MCKQFFQCLLLLLGHANKHCGERFSSTTVNTFISNVKDFHQHREKHVSTVKDSLLLGMANGKSETRRDAETGIFKSETETENFSDLIRKAYI